MIEKITKDSRQETPHPLTIHKFTAFVFIFALYGATCTASKTELSDAPINPDNDASINPDNDASINPDDDAPINPDDDAPKQAYICSNGNPTEGTTELGNTIIESCLQGECNEFYHGEEIPGSEERLQCVINKHTCSTFGGVVDSSSFVAVHESENCSSCPTGFDRKLVTGETARYKCVEIPFICPSGTPVQASSGDRPVSTGIVKCAACNQSYTLVNDICLKNVGNSNSQDYPKQCSGINSVCKFPLPIFVHGSFEDPELAVVDLRIKAIAILDTEEIAKQFPRGANLKYSITKGNPNYHMSYTNLESAIITGNRRLVASTDDPEKYKVRHYRLKGYRITNNGEIYVRDAWVLGRNSSDYLNLEDKNAFIARGNHPKRFAHGCGGTDNCPDGQEYVPHQDYTHYTFRRTETDSLTIQVTDTNSGGTTLTLQVVIEPNPITKNLVADCKQSDPFDKFGCRYASEIIPQTNIQTTEAHRNALPNGLALPKSQYDMVASIEFDSLEDTLRYFTSPIFKDPTRLEVSDGKLKMHHRRGMTADRICILTGAPYMTSDGLFEPSSGYLEVKYDKFPNLSANSGNFLLWSRYGAHHSAFKLGLPSTLLDGITILDRLQLAKTGFVEIDLLERWADGMSSPYFVAHSWPGTKVNLGDIKVRGKKGRLWKPGWMFEVNDRRGRTTQYLSGIAGLEMAPGTGMQIFKNGNEVLTDGHQMQTFEQGAARYLLLNGIFHSHSLGFSCDKLRWPVEDIEIDYIRLFKPRDGY